MTPEPDHPQLDSATLARRRELVAQVRHSTEMEGGRSGPEARELQERYMAGEFDAAELRRRTRELHGL